ncbi:hypothetical protein [Dactylosporangium sp. CA-233914]|uniref:hypothetical protein n=1 Tax=Dactylosporangium sp. CA-233914 TaxID=3239934 RepID=UPI003D932ED1
MRLFNDGDERLFHAVTVAVRLGRSAKLVKALAADYDEYWDDPEAGFKYALALVAAMQAGGTEQRNHDRYAKSLEALDDVLDGMPEHWPARYCRVRHRVLVRTGYGRYQEYAGDDRDKVAEDLASLLHGQQQDQPWQPYFTAAAMLAAQFHAGQGDQAQAAALIDDAAGRPRAPIPYPALGAILVDPFLTLFHGSAPPPQRATVGAVMAALFPANPAVQATIRGTGTAVPA